MNQIKLGVGSRSNYRIGRAINMALESPLTLSLEAIEARKILSKVKLKCRDDAVVGEIIAWELENETD